MKTRRDRARRAILRAKVVRNSDDPKPIIWQCDTTVVLLLRLPSCEKAITRLHVYSSTFTCRWYRITRASTTALINSLSYVRVRISTVGAAAQPLLYLWARGRTNKWLDQDHKCKKRNLKKGTLRDFRTREPTASFVVVIVVVVAIYLNARFTLVELFPLAGACVGCPHTEASKRSLLTLCTHIDASNLTDKFIHIHVDAVFQ